MDDEIDITSSIKLGLEHRGFRVDAYTDPVAALAKATPGRYDLAIFDIRMPMMTGFELYRRFREIDDKVGICFMTGYYVRGAEFKTMFPDVRAVGFFKKPISIETLAKEIRRLIGEKVDLQIRG